jgi:hypothetical protein
MLQALEMAQTTIVVQAAWRSLVRYRPVSIIN